MSHITLSEAERDSFLKDAKREFVIEMIAAHGDDMMMISQAQTAGIFDCQVATLEKMGLPRVEIRPRVYRYRIADIKALIAKKRA